MNITSPCPPTIKQKNRHIIGADYCGKWRIDSVKGRIDSLNVCSCRVVADMV
jgi:hypothetical protein